MQSTSKLSDLILPDFFSYCTYPRRVNVMSSDAARASEQWLLSQANFDPSQRDVFFALKAGELAGLCFPNAHPYRLRLCCDAINYLFNLNELSHEFDPSDISGFSNCVLSALNDPRGFETEKTVGILAKDFFSPLKSTAGTACSRRFIRAMEKIFAAFQQEANSVGVPDLESYISFRRNTSGCRTCFALIEYANAIDLPDEVMEHPIIRALEEAANDIISWSNDILSFSVEQARGEARNMITVLMKHRHFGLQEAVNYVDDLCQASLARFENDRNLIPSFDPETDKLVKIYIEGLQHGIIGSLHWSFETERYFGKAGPEIKIHRIVRLCVKRRT